jgi:hypothetical protein
MARQPISVIIIDSGLYEYYHRESIERELKTDNADYKPTATRTESAPSVVHAFHDCLAI